MLVLEGSVPNEQISGEGHWAALGVDPATGDPIPTNTWIDRLAPRAAAVLALGTCAAYGGVPAMRGNPTGAMGLRDYLGASWESRLGVPIVNLPGCPVQPDNITETLLHLALHVSGVGGIELDEQGRRNGCSGARVQESCGRPASPIRASSRASPATRAAAWSSSAARAPSSSATCRCAAGQLASAAAPTSAASATVARCPAFPIASCRSWSPARSGWRRRGCASSPTARCSRGCASGDAACGVMGRRGLLASGAGEPS